MVKIDTAMKSMRRSIFPDHPCMEETHVTYIDPIFITPRHYSSPVWQLSSAACCRSKHRSTHLTTPPGTSDGSGQRKPLQAGDRGTASRDASSPALRVTRFWAEDRFTWATASDLEAKVAVERALQTIASGLVSFTKRTNYLSLGLVPIVPTITGLPFESVLLVVFIDGPQRDRHVFPMFSLSLHLQVPPQVRYDSTLLAPTPVATEPQVRFDWRPNGYISGTPTGLTHSRH